MGESLYQIARLWVRTNRGWGQWNRTVFGDANEKGLWCNGENETRSKEKKRVGGREKNSVTGKEIEKAYGEQTVRAFWGFVVCGGFGVGAIEGKGKRGEQKGCFIRSKKHKDMDWKPAQIKKKGGKGEKTAGKGRGRGRGGAKGGIIHLGRG